MSQTSILVRLELRRMAREPGTVMVVATLVVLLSLALTAGAGRVRTARDTTRLLEAHQAGILAAIAQAAGHADDAPDGWNASNPDYVANDRGTVAFAAPPALLALSLGQTDLHPVQLKVTASSREEATPAAAIAHPLTAMLGALDADFVVVYLWPLSIVALLVDPFAGGRTSGPFRLLALVPVRPTPVVLAPVLARSGVALLALMAPLTLLAWSGAAPLSWQLAFWMLAVAAYGSVWVGLSIWVASRGQSAAVNALWLGTAWVLTVLVVPGIVTMAVGAAVTAPSGVALADATRAATREALSDGSRVLGHFLEDHPAASAVGRDGLRQFALLQAARDEEIRRRLAPVVARYTAAHASQQRVMAAASYLSPALLVADALQQAAGTSRERASSFRAQVEAFRVRWRAYFQPAILAGRRVTREDAARMPVFAHVEETANEVWRRSAMPSLVMGVLGMVLVARGIGHVRRWSTGGVP